MRQQKAKPVIGFLNSGSPGRPAPNLAAFRETGYVEGQNVAIATTDGPARAVAERRCSDHTDEVAAPYDRL
jgi:hypothetical protein